MEKIAKKEGVNLDDLGFSFDIANEDVDESKQKLTLFGCEAGMDSYTITWDGKLLACQMLGEFYTNPFEDGFIKAWNKYPYKVKLPKLDDKCLKCENIDICKACPACRYAETGSLGGCPEYVCQDLKELLRFSRNE